MSASALTSIDVFNIVTSFALTLLILYAAWINLVRKKISAFGFDAFLLFIMRLIDKKQAEIVHRKPELIRRMGVLMLIMGIGGIYSLIDLLLSLYGH